VEQLMTRILEIRTYNLHPGTRDDFHALVVEHSLPMLERWKMDVVGYGGSAHDDDTYYLMRSFASLADRDAQEDAFYGSDEWRQGPRESILALIESFTTLVVEVDQATLDGMRR
jgi:hypothetical protein